MKLPLALLAAILAVGPSKASHPSTSRSSQDGSSSAPASRQERVPIPAGASIIAETSRFRLVATPGASGLAAALADEVEDLRDRIASDLGRDYEGTTEVRIADNSASFQALQPYGRTVPSWAVGVAWPAHNLIVLNSGQGRRPNQIRQTLAHEVSHIALGRLAPNAFPRWFLEGMATYHSAEWRFTRAGTLAGAVMRDGIIPFNELDRGWPDTPAEVRLAYAQSDDFVSWLFRNFGVPSIHRLIDGVVEGNSFGEAVEVATGVPFWKLEHSWRSSLPARYTWVPAITSGGFVWGVATIVFLMAYFRKRREKSRRLAAMAEAELMYESENSYETHDMEPSEYDRLN